jgi:cell division protein FtsZ
MRVSVVATGIDVAVPEPRVARSRPVEAEPMLFAELAPEPAVAAPPADEDLPPPAYQPRMAEPEYEPMPAPAAPGDVRPEVRARLMAAVNKTPVGEAPRPAPQGEPRSPAERKRFGINSLINRMTGQGSDAVAGNPGGAHYATERSEPDWDDQPEERADIPAFLRRQAN